MGICLYCRRPLSSPFTPRPPPEPRVNPNRCGRNGLPAHAAIQLSSPGERMPCLLYTVLHDVGQLMEVAIRVDEDAPPRGGHGAPLRSAPLKNGWWSFPKRHLSRRRGSSTHHAASRVGGVEKGGFSCCSCWGSGERDRDRLGRHVSIRHIHGEHPRAQPCHIERPPGGRRWPPAGASPTTARAGPWMGESAAWAS